jgi:hypothetical protein
LKVKIVAEPMLYFRMTIPEPPAPDALLKPEYVANRHHHRRLY